MTLNIVIPVLNEQKSIRNGVEKTVQFLNTTNVKGNFIITIADNGSDDLTEEISNELCSEYDYVHYFKVSERGVGLAFREAIKKNNSDIIGYMDVDLATDIKHIKTVYNSFLNDKVSIIVGSRLLHNSKVYNRTVTRGITSRGLNMLLKILLRVNFSDAMCGFKFYKKSVAEQLVAQCSDNNGWFYCAEMMIRAEWDKIKITQIPVVWTDDIESKVKIGKLSVSYMSDILKLYNEKKGK